MRLPLLLCWMLTFVGAFARDVRADVAAAQFVGHGLKPVAVPGVRMVSAKVDIQWGEPGKLVAVFLLRNETPSPVDGRLGFPVSLPEMFRGKDFRRDFKMSFDGVPVDQAAIRQDTPAKDSYGVGAQTIWFDCRHVLPPGPTTVRVETRLPATMAYHLPYRQELFYCVQTGAGWKGPIGFEEIAVHFPGPIQPGELLQIQPAGSIVKGATVRWHFENFEPIKGDHDVSLQFLQPDVLPILARLRRRADADPNNARKQLVLIQHLFALCPWPETEPYPPYQLSQAGYHELLSITRDAADRTLIHSLYARKANGYQRLPYLTTRQDDQVTSLLHAADYVPPRGRSPFLAEGWARLRQLLAEHPHDATAWNTLLLQSTGVQGPEYHAAFPFQLAQIKAARQNCPEDPALKDWDLLGQLSRRIAADPRRQPAPGEDFTPDGKQLQETKLRLQRELERTGLVDRHGGFPARYESRSRDYFAGWLFP